MAVNKDQESNINLESTVELNENNQQYFIDRKYRSNHKYIDDQTRQKRSPHYKKCFVCRRQGCWSSRHSNAEREKAKAKYREQFGRVAEARYDQFLKEFEEDKPTDDYDDIEAIEAMVANMEDISITDQEYFMTYAGKLDTKEACSMITKLYERSATHAFLKYVDGMEDADTPSKTKNGAPISTEDRYGPELFYGIMIDTGAAGKSTAGYN